MSITINGTTNTLTAASGLTVAGNTAVTGTLSSTGQLQNTNGSGNSGQWASITGAGTSISYLRHSNTGGDISFGVAGSSAALVGGSAYSTFLNTNTATNIEFGVNGSLKGTFSSTALTLGTGVNLTIADGKAVAWGASNTYIQGSTAAGTLGAYIGATKCWEIDGTGSTSFSFSPLPSADNTINLGSASLGWKELFCDNGTINTSDARRKTAVSALSAAEINASKQLGKEIGSFKFLAALDAKGDAARLHIGMTVQRAIEIMEANGLDPFAYSFICHDAWGDVFVDHPAVDAIAAQEAVLDEDGNVITPAVDAVEGQAAWTEQTQVAGDKYSFRVHELLLFMAAGFEARLSALEAA